MRIKYSKMEFAMNISYAYVKADRICKRKLKCIL